MTSPACDLATARRRKLALRAGGIVVVLGLCAWVRVWLIRNSPVVSSRDGMLYVELARAWSADPGRLVRTHPMHPGYPAAMAGVHRLLYGPGGGGDPRTWELSGQIVSFAAAMAGMAALWWFAAMAFDWRIAWITCLLFGLSRRWAVLGSDALSDALATCMQLWAAVLALLAVRLMRRRRWWAVAAAAAVGALTAAGYHVRLDALAMLPVAVILWGLVQLRERLRWRITLVCSAAAVLAFLACAAPYMSAIGGLTRKKRLEDFVCRPERRDVCLAQVSPLGDTRYAPPRKYANRFFEAMHPILATLMCQWLATWIGWRALRLNLPREVRLRPEWSAGALLAIAVAVISPPLLAHYVNIGALSHRYLVPLAALLSPLAGAAVLILAAWCVVVWRRLFGRRPSVYWFTGAILAAIVTALAFHTLRPLHPGLGYYRDAARFVRAQAGTDGVVLSDKHYVTCYARGKSYLFSRAALRNARLLLGFVATSRGTLLAISREAVDEADASLRQALRPPAFTEIGVFHGDGREDSGAIHVYRVDGKASRAALIALTRPPRPKPATTRPRT